MTRRTKARPHGNFQQSDSQTKIFSPCCGASTNSYAASYRQISTNIEKPTMTLLTGTTSPTLQQKTVKYQTKMVSNKITTATITLQPVSPKPCSDKPLPAIHHHLEITQMTVPTNPLPYESVNGCNTIKSDHATKSTSMMYPTHISFPSLSPSRNPHCSISKNQSINPIHSSTIHPLKHSPSYSMAQPNSICHCQSLHMDN